MSFAKLCMVAVVGALAQPVLAEPPPVNGAALGQLEAVLEHCREVSPANAERYQAFAKALTGEAKEKELTELRSSGEYRAAHEEASESLAALTREEAEKACAEGLEPAAR